MAYSFAYSSITRYHMTQGWQNFFQSVHRIICCLFKPGEYINAERTIENGFKELRYAVNRLKREPKVTPRTNNASIQEKIHP